MALIKIFIFVFVFMSVVYCQNNALNRCLLPIDPGNCGALYLLNTPVQRYGFDWRSSNCVQFTYSRCGGNRNRFRTYTECITACNPGQLVVNGLLSLVQAAING